MSRRNDLIDLAGDMWNELENLRSLWEGTDRAPQCESLIAEYEQITERVREGAVPPTRLAGAHTHDCRDDACDGCFPYPGAVPPTDENRAWWHGEISDDVAEQLGASVPSTEPRSPWEHMPDGGDAAHRAALREAIERASKRERNYDQPWWASNMRMALFYIEQLEAALGAVPPTRYEPAGWLRFAQLDEPRGAVGVVISKYAEGWKDDADVPVFVEVRGEREDTDGGL